MNRLQGILETKAEEVKKIIPLEEKLRYAALERNDFRSLENALRSEDDELTLIAEVKKASPSAGTIAEDFDPVAQAVAYAKGGANAISVLTDEVYFKGKLSYLSQIREQIPLPILRKDFIIHESQIYESVVAGADAILLIVAAMSQERLVALLDLAYTCQLDVLMEVHDQEEMDRALETEARIIGVNNRNLKSFEVDLNTTEVLSHSVDPDLIFVSESGIKTPEDAQKVYSWGANAILVGESLMRATDVGRAVKELLAVTPNPAD